MLEKIRRTTVCKLGLFVSVLEFVENGDTRDKIAPIVPAIGCDFDVGLYVHLFCNLEICAEEVKRAFSVLHHWEIANFVCVGVGVKQNIYPRTMRATFSFRLATP